MEDGTQNKCSRMEVTQKVGSCRCFPHLDALRCTQVVLSGPPFPQVQQGMRVDDAQRHKFEHMLVFIVDLQIQSKFHFRKRRLPLIYILLLCLQIYTYIKSLCFHRSEPIRVAYRHHSFNFLWDGKPTSPAHSAELTLCWVVIWLVNSTL